jgi:8-oxo-dGTP pyrophosphatase MutT (NUDIX family)
VTTEFRAAARVLCVDACDQVLLLRWRDPYDGRLLWEPPGGGIEPGETAAEAACRELAEETGLRATLHESQAVMVDCDVMWNGTRQVGQESYFLAHFDVEAPTLSRASLLEYESLSLVEHRWTRWDQTERLPGPVQPVNIVEVLRRLAPSGPWA